MDKMFKWQWLNKMDQIPNVNIQLDFGAIDQSYTAVMHTFFNF